MTHPFLALCAVVLTATLLGAAQPRAVAAQRPPTRAGTNAAGSAEARREVLRLTATWAHAVSRSDTAAVRRLLATDYMGTEADGTFHGVAEELRSVIPPGGGPPWALALADTTARVYGDAAVVTGRMTVTGASRAVYRFTFTAVRQPRTRTGWRFVAAHWTTVADTSGAPAPR